LKYRPEIDGLRAIAVVAVVLYHLNYGVQGGYLGVDIFFVISGYLITKIISSEIESGDFTIAGFYERRVRRIFPALFVMLFAVTLAGWFVLLPLDYAKTMRAVIATILFGSNILFWHGGGYFAVASGLNPLLHTWSLAVEEQFYVFFPLFLLLAYRIFPKHLRSLCVVVAIVSIVAGVHYEQRAPDAVFYMTPFRAWELLAGSLLAFRGLRLPSRKWQCEALGLIGLACIAYSLFHFSASSPFPGNAILAVLGAVALIYSSAGGETTWASRLLSIRAVRYVGAISYSLYLWHWPVIVLTSFRADLHPGPVATAGMLAGSVVLAVLSYHFVEQPFRRRKLGASRNRLFAMAAASMVAMIGIGAAGMLEHGIPRRFDTRTANLDALRQPQVPYRSCLEGRKTCILGDDRAPRPSLLVWGDSHALAWAPAIDLILKRAGQSAYLVIDHWCPPLLNVHDAQNPRCYVHNLDARKLVDGSTGLRTVLLIGMWHSYFNPGQRILHDDKSPAGSGSVAADGMQSTLLFLKAKGLNAILLGDVPGQQEDVPLAMALATAPLPCGRSPSNRCASGIARSRSWPWPRRRTAWQPMSTWFHGFAIHPYADLRRAMSHCTGTTIT
jgi:peptidoglycan/LPS O-acetylase OafA/YrhL